MNELNLKKMTPRHKDNGDNYIINFLYFKKYLK